MGKLSCHRTNRIVVMAWLVSDLTARGQLAGLFLVLRPALVETGPDDRAPHRTAHALPGDRWSGVQECAANKRVRHSLARRVHIDDAGMGRQHALDRNLVGLLNLLAGQ